MGNENKGNQGNQGKQDQPAPYTKICDYYDYLTECNRVPYGAKCLNINIEKKLGDDTFIARPVDIQNGECRAIQFQFNEAEVNTNPPEYFRIAGGPVDDTRLISNTSISPQSVRDYSGMTPIRLNPQPTLRQIMKMKNHTMEKSEIDVFRPTKGSMTINPSSATQEINIFNDKTHTDNINGIEINSDVSAITSFLSRESCTYFNTANPHVRVNVDQFLNNVSFYELSEVSSVFAPLMKEDTAFFSQNSELDTSSYIQFKNVEGQAVLEEATKKLQQKYVELRNSRIGNISAEAANMNRYVVAHTAACSKVMDTIEFKNEATLLLTEARAKQVDFMIRETETQLASAMARYGSNIGEIDVKVFDLSNRLESLKAEANCANAKHRLAETHPELIRNFNEPLSTFMITYDSVMKNIESQTTIQSGAVAMSNEARTQMDRDIQTLSDLREIIKTHPENRELFNPTQVYEVSDKMFVDISTIAALEKLVISNIDREVNVNLLSSRNGCEQMKAALNASMKDFSITFKSPDETENIEISLRAMSNYSDIRDQITQIVSSNLPENKIPTEADIERVSMLVKDKLFQKTVTGAEAVGNEKIKPQENAELEFAKYVARKSIIIGVIDTHVNENGFRVNPENYQALSDLNNQIRIAKYLKDNHEQKITNIYKKNNPNQTALGHEAAISEIVSTLKFELNLNDVEIRNLESHGNNFFRSETFNQLVKNPSDVKATIGFGEGTSEIKIPKIFNEQPLSEVLVSPELCRKAVNELQESIKKYSKPSIGSGDSVIDVVNAPKVRIAKVYLEELKAHIQHNEIRLANENILYFKNEGLTLTIPPEALAQLSNDKRLVTEVGAEKLKSFVSNPENLHEAFRLGNASTQATLIEIAKDSPYSYSKEYVEKLTKSISDCELKEASLFAAVSLFHEKIKDTSPTIDESKNIVSKMNVSSDDIKRVLSEYPVNNLDEKAVIAETKDLFQKHSSTISDQAHDKTLPADMIKLATRLNDLGLSSENNKNLSNPNMVQIMGIEAYDADKFLTKHYERQLACKLNSEEIVYSSEHKTNLFLQNLCEAHKLNIDVVKVSEAITRSETAYDSFVELKGKLDTINTKCIDEQAKETRKDDLGDKHKTEIATSAEAEAKVAINEFFEENSKLRGIMSSVSSQNGASALWNTIETSRLETKEIQMNELKNIIVEFKEVGSAVSTFGMGVNAIGLRGEVGQNIPDANLYNLVMDGSTRAKLGEELNKMLEGTKVGEHVSEISQCLNQIDSLQSNLRYVENVAQSTLTNEKTLVASAYESERISLESKIEQYRQIENKESNPTVVDTPALKESFLARIRRSGPEPKAGAEMRAQAFDDVSLTISQINGYLAKVEELTGVKWETGTPVEHYVSDIKSMLKSSEEIFIKAPEGTDHTLVIDNGKSLVDTTRLSTNLIETINSNTELKEIVKNSLEFERLTTDANGGAVAYSHNTIQDIIHVSTQCKSNIEFANEFAAIINTAEIIKENYEDVHRMAYINSMKNLLERLDVASSQVTPTELKHVTEQEVGVRLDINVLQADAPIKLEHELKELKQSYDQFESKVQQLNAICDKFVGLNVDDVNSRALQDSLGSILNDINDITTKHNNRILALTAEDGDVVKAIAASSSAIANLENSGLNYQVDKLNGRESSLILNSPIATEGIYLKAITIDSAAINSNLESLLVKYDINHTVLEAINSDERVSQVSYAQPNASLLKDNAAKEDKAKEAEDADKTRESKKATIAHEEAREI